MRSGEEGSKNPFVEDKFAGAGSAWREAARTTQKKEIKKRVFIVKEILLRVRKDFQTHTMPAEHHRESRARRSAVLQEESLQWPIQEQREPF